MSTATAETYDATKHELIPKAEAAQIRKNAKAAAAIRFKYENYCADAAPAATRRAELQALRWRLGVAEASQFTRTPPSSRAQRQLPVRASASAQPWGRSARGWRFIAVRAAQRTENARELATALKTGGRMPSPKMRSERDMARQRTARVNMGPRLPVPVSSTPCRSA